MTDKSDRRTKAGLPAHAAVAVALVVAIIAGCGSEQQSGPPLIPVSGKVMLNGKLLTTGGTVSYRDASMLVQPSGVIAADGTYKLFTDNREGAPAGQYRIVVFASEPRAETAGHGGLPRLIVNRQFMDPAATPLKVEVKEGNSPDTYNLMVTGTR